MEAPPTRRLFKIWILSLVLWNFASEVRADDSLSAELPDWIQRAPAVLEPYDTDAPIDRNQLQARRLELERLYLENVMAMSATPGAGRKASFRRIKLASNIKLVKIQLDQINRSAKTKI